MAQPAITIVAHRGLHHTLPENSVESMRAAWSRGIIWAECDVHFSRDGAAVVLHDPTLDRTTSGSGPVEAHTLEELRRLRLRDASGDVTTCALPTLDEVIADMPPQAGLLIEFKQIPPIPSAIELLARLAVGRVSYQSFHEADLMLFEQAKPSVGFSWLLDQPSHIEAAIASRWRTLYVNHASLDERLARRIIESGKIFGVWTVNDEENMRRTASLGAATLITDQPELAQRVLA